MEWMSKLLCFVYTVWMLFSMNVNSWFLSLIKIEKINKFNKEESFDVMFSNEKPEFVDKI